MLYCINKIKSDVYVVITHHVRLALIVVSVSATHAVASWRPDRVIQKTITKMVQLMCQAGYKFDSAARLSKRPGNIRNCLWGHALKVRGPFVQTLCIEKESYMDAI